LSYEKHPKFMREEAPAKVQLTDKRFHTRNQEHGLLATPLLKAPDEKVEAI
jgi:hypothetical protein